MIPDVAVGAIAAALIGAIISLVGLIVAKESKVSEFRQSWIDALRVELSAFLSSANAAVDAQKLSFKNDTERFKTLQPFYQNLNENYYLIALRLNSKEDNSKNLKACMIGISAFVKDSGSDFDFFESRRVDFINISNALLKEEWTRVKAGEPVYRISRWIAAVATLVLLVAVVAVVLKTPAAPAPTRITKISKAAVPSKDATLTPATKNAGPALPATAARQVPASEPPHQR